MRKLGLGCSKCRWTGYCRTCKQRRAEQAQLDKEAKEGDGNAEITEHAQLATEAKKGDGCEEIAEQAQLGAEAKKGNGGEEIALMEIDDEMGEESPESSFEA